jgi:hypothetical protein
MSEPMSSLEIEDVLASIRRLVSDDLRPANRPSPSKLILTPALRVVGQVPDADAEATAQGGPPTGTWVPDQSTLDAMADANGDHLDFGSHGSMTGLGPQARTTMDAMQSAAEAFHSQADEFILSVSDSGSMVLHGEGRPVLEEDSALPARPDRSAGPGAVFAVLTGAVPEAEVHLPEAAELADAEGGAPIEDEADWSVVAWDDAAPLAQDLQADDASVGVTGPEPLILSFVSARRAAVMDEQAAMTAEDEGLVGGGDAPALDVRVTVETSGDLAVPVHGAVAQEAGIPVPTEMPIVGDLGERAAEGLVPADPPADGGSDPVLQPEDAVLAETPSMADVIEAVAGPVTASGAESPKVLATMWDAAMEMDLEVPAPELAISPNAIPVETAEIVLLVSAALPVDPLPKPLPGWAQSTAEVAGGAPLAEITPDAPPASFVASSRRRAKAAAQDPGWADRAEAEIHRQLAAELGTVALHEAQASAVGLTISEPALRDLVRDLIHEELAGKLGERITQNIRKLVQLELQRTTSVQVHDFRSSRMDAGSSEG